MAIITIFGATFGDDAEIARRVAQTLGYRDVGRDILVAAARRCEVPEAKLDEILKREPTWWTRWNENLRPYRIALQAGMSEAALADNLVYYGHVGHGLLPQVRHVVRVLLSAPMEFRLQQVRLLRDWDAGAARSYIEQVEKARSRRLMALFGQDWRDLGQYELILNLGQMTSAAAERVIAFTAQLAGYQATEESRRRLTDFALSSKIQAHLLTFPRLRDLDIRVEANAGAITLSGFIPSSLEKEEITREVVVVPGVRAIHLDLIRMPESVWRVT